MKKLTILLTALLVITIIIGSDEDSHEQNYAVDGQYTADSIGLLGADSHYSVFGATYAK